MMHTIQVEIDANGYVHPLEVLTQIPVGRALLTLLPVEKNILAKDQGVNDLFGILQANRGITIEEMQEAIKQKAGADFNDSH